MARRSSAASGRMCLTRRLRIEFKMPRPHGGELRRHGSERAKPSEPELLLLASLHEERDDRGWIEPNGQSTTLHYSRWRQRTARDLADAMGTAETVRCRTLLRIQSKNLGRGSLPRNERDASHHNGSSQRRGCEACCWLRTEPLEGQELLAVFHSPRGANCRGCGACETEAPSCM
jgi:hypothetical protein